MIVYHLDYEESGKFFRYFSEQFPSVNGYGSSQNEALLDYLDKHTNELNRIIRNNERFPKPLTHEQIAGV